MNIQIQCCALAILLVVLYFYMSYRKAVLFEDDSFIRVFITAFASVSLDIISVLMIYWEEYLPNWLVDFVCKMYLVTAIWVAYATLMYILNDIYEFKEDYNKQKSSYGAFGFVGSVLAVSFDITRIHEANVIYTKGPSVLVTYIFALFLILNAWFICWRMKNKVNQRRREAIQIWMALWAIMALVQMLKTGWLLISFACSLGMVVLYLKLENPERNLDRYTGIFNFNAFVHYIHRIFWDNKDISVITLIFEHKHNVGLQGNREAFLELTSDLFAIQGAKTFRYSDDEVLIAFEKKEVAQCWLNQQEQYFSHTFGKTKPVVLEPKVMYFPSVKIVTNDDDLLHLIRYTRQKWKEYSDDDFLVVEQTIVQNMIKEKEVEVLIMDSIKHDRVEVFYQPIFSTKEQEFTSAEALVRIRDEEGKIVPPGIFIPVAEQNGMIIQLGEIVFEKVCSFLHRENPQQYGIEYIEVNLSVVQCADEKLAEVYINIMEKYGIKPNQINLEITESASLSAKKILLNNMGIMRKYGISFSLDDFGTGQSNLNYIVDMPVDIVKFDRDMTNVYFENGKAKYVMDAAMHMIHGLKLEIVSEGIETEEQYKTMKDLGISYIQGYYFSKPLPENEFLSFISKQRMAG